MMPFCAIVVDLDGTLLHSDKTISPFTASVLQKCREKEIKIIAATARPLRAVEDFCKTVTFDAMAMSNGARLLWSGQRREYGIPTEDGKRLLTKLLNYPELRITLETGDEAYSNVSVPDYDTVLTDDLVGVMEREGALKLIVRLDDDKTLEFVKSLLPESVYFTVANGVLMQIMAREATKIDGVSAILNTQGLSLSDAVYFGDDEDDIACIRQCKIGVAMENAGADVKAAADFIAESNDHDGVAKFLTQYL